VCFHCQQTAEKYLKALLEERGATIPKTHDLEKLLALLVPHYANLESQSRSAQILTEYAVGPRYPGENATKREAQTAIRRAGQLRGACRAQLNIKKPRKKRKKKRRKRKGP